MKVLVSGSHGLIGTALRRRLADGGHAFVALTRPPVGRGGGDEPGSVAWDPARGTIDRRALEDLGPYDAVVHLAGAGIADRRWTPARRRELVGSRVDATSLLASAIAERQPVPPAFVCASAVGYYGNRADEVLTEEAAAGTGFLADLCRAWEGAATPAADAGSRVVLLRLGVVLAPRGGILERLLPLFRLGLGGRLGSGRQYVSWVALDDVIGAIEAALTDRRLAGAVNVTAPGPVRNAELTRALASALHRPALLAVPRPAVELALGRGLAGELLFFSQRAVPARLLAAGHPFLHPDIDTALASLVGAGTATKRSG